MSRSSTILKIALPVGIVLIAFAVMIALIKMRHSPEKTEPRKTGVLVKVMRLESTGLNARVDGTGTVRAEREVTIVSQVSGEVISTSKNFVEGGFFKKGDVLFRIDDTDYMLALKQAEASEARAEYELEQIKSRADIAKREWEIISGTAGALAPGDSAQEAGVSPNPLVLYGPQLKNARSALESASASVAQARLNLERTVERAPFDCRVRQKSIDTGQYVRAGTQVGLLAGTASAEVVIPLEREELNWISIPGINSRDKGSRASITIPGDSQHNVWQGRVVRSSGEVDMKSRTVQVVVAVDDPYGLKRSGRGLPPLLSGSFVNVTITGNRMENVFSIPRHTLRDNNTVWLMEEDNTMAIVPVTLARIEGENVIISGGLKEGSRLVLTRVSGAADGLRLRDMDASALSMENTPAADTPADRSGEPSGAPLPKEDPSQAPVPQK